LVGHFKDKVPNLVALFIVLSVALERAKNISSTILGQLYRQLWAYGGYRAILEDNSNLNDVHHGKR
jgi:hypothetical protein